jgi:peptidoglycan hydrolase CwlO-like protein
MLKRSITLGELVTASILLIGTILGFWINTNVRLSALEINKQTQDSNYNEARQSFKEIGNKLDKLNDGQNEIKVSLQNKMDRKN